MGYRRGKGRRSRRYSSKRVHPINNAGVMSRGGFRL